MVSGFPQPRASAFGPGLGSPGPLGRSVQEFKIPGARVPEGRPPNRTGSEGVYLLGGRHRESLRPQERSVPGKKHARPEMPFLLRGNSRDGKPRRGKELRCTESASGELDVSRLSGSGKGVTAEGVLSRGRATGWKGGSRNGPDEYGGLCSSAVASASSPFSARRRRTLRDVLLSARRTRFLRDAVASGEAPRNPAGRGRSLRRHSKSSGLPSNSTACRKTL